jgi:hypothetical protein
MISYFKRYLWARAARLGAPGWAAGASWIMRDRRAVEKIRILAEHELWEAVQGYLDLLDAGKEV